MMRNFDEKITDSAIIWINGRGDLTLDAQKDNDDLLVDTSLTNQVIISLFTDRAVSDYELEKNQLNRGFWGDSYSDQPWGSRLWLLGREKSTDEVCKRAKHYAEEALEWMIKDELATEIEVIAIRESLNKNNVKELMILDIYLALKSGAIAQRTLKMELTNAV